MSTANLISLHGGHSGQFCCHAEDMLEDIILSYIDKGFKSVGITEHAPPSGNHLRYPDEVDAGLSAKELETRFAQYMTTVRELQKKYSGQIRIYAGMETETCTGFEAHTKKLIQKFGPDYIVGSVHHVNDICFDYSKEAYDGLAQSLGSVEALYLAYFDLQYEMIKKLKPFVVGHFDLVRIYDDAFEKHLVLPKVSEKIQRNLSLIQSLDLVMDFNLRPLAKGVDTPYPAPVILEQAKSLDIRMVPGDDSHSKAQAGNHVAWAVDHLESLGFDTKWPEPELLG